MSCGCSGRKVRLGIGFTAVEPSLELSSPEVGMEFSGAGDMAVALTFTEVGMAFSGNEFSLCLRSDMYVPETGVLGYAEGTLGYGDGEELGYIGRKRI